MQGRRDFVTREPINGDLLSERMRKGPMSVEEIIGLAVEIGMAIHRTHERGRVHGGLCPFCIVVTRNGVALCDPPSSPVDRAPYQSPEQYAGQQPDARSDIFAFGAVLYEMVSGSRPFPGTGSQLQEAILHREPAKYEARSNAHALLARLLTACLEKDPGRRRQRINNAVIELKMCRTMIRTAELSTRRHALPPGSDPARLGAVPLPPAAARTAFPRSRTITAAPPEVLAPASSATTLSAPPAMPRAATSPAPPPDAPGLRPRPPARSVMPVPAGLLKYAGGLSPRFWLAAGTVLLLTASSFAAVVMLRGRSAPPVLQFSVSQPENTSYPGMPAVSPDGRYLTFSAIGQEGKRILWLRPLDALHATMIPGTEGASAPFWSPDSQYVAFFAGRSLKRVRITAGATPETICAAEAAPGGGAWNQEGTILFSPGLSDGFFQVPASGGDQPRPVLSLDDHKLERADLWPQFLPDGKHFVFYLQTDLTETSGVYLGSLGSREYKKLFTSQTNAVYSSGYLLYIEERNLMAQPFDAGKLATTDSPTTLGNDIGGLRSLSLAPISVSGNGVLVYQGVGEALHQIVWMDRSGRQLAPVGEPGEYGPPRISPSGDRAAVARMDPDKKVANLWLAELNGTLTRLSNGPVHEGAPVWSPDGSKIAYFAKQDQAYDLYQRAAVPNAKPELLYKSAVMKYPTDWSHDGRYVLFYQSAEGTRLDIWGYSTVERRAAPILNTVYTEGFATLSPNGKWMAFQTDQSGHNEVWVQEFDGLGGGTRKMWQVSNGGGLPRWRADSAELFYMTADGCVMAVAVRENGNGEFQSGTPQKLFQTRPLPKTWTLYDVSGDGQRFIVNLPQEWTSSVPITVVTNWVQKLSE